MQHLKDKIRSSCVAPLLACCAVLAACGGGETATRDGKTTQVINEGGCDLENVTATCTCADKNNIPGRQTCHGGKWSACECVAISSGTAGAAGGGGTGGTGGSAGMDGATVADPPGNSSAKRFAWKTTPFELGVCKAGHYVGNFDGLYMSPAAGFGGISFAPVPVVGASVDGSPPLEFWLEKVPGTGELFKINMGKMQGTANGAFPFSADLTGDLDCATKKFNGLMMNGQYMVGTMPYYFEGTLVSDYDKIQNKFINGMWTCTEPMSVNGGGNGTWEVSWQAN